MATGKGFTSQMALGIEAAYRGVVTVDELIPYITESMTHEYVDIPNEVLDGHGGRKLSDRGGKMVRGSFDVDVVVDEIAGDKYGIEALLLATMGSASMVATRTQYTIINTLATYLTIALNDEVSVTEYISCKFTGLTYNVSMGVTPRITFRFIAYNRLITGQAGITNTAGDITGLSPTNDDPVKHIFDKGHCVFRIGDDTNILADGDRMTISNFTLDFDRNLSEPTFATRAHTGHTDAELTLEPIEDGFRTNSLTFDVPHYDADTYQDWWDDEELLQLDLKFLRSTMEHNIYVPSLQIKNVSAPIDGPGLIVQTVTAEFARQEGVIQEFTDGVTVIGEEFGIEIKSNRAAAPS